MKKEERQKKLLPQKLGYTLGVLFVYMLCRRITLYGADLNYYIHRTMDAGGMLEQTIGGDIRSISVFTLGISPFMIASILMMMVSAVMRANSKSKISMKKMNKVTLYGTFVIAVVQAVLFINKMHYAVDPDKWVLANIASGTELVAGAMLICWLIDQNKEFGIGQQSALILVNIQESVMVTISSHSAAELRLPILWGVFGMLVMLIMENAEYRVPLQRVSIHNIYSDKNYQAFKLNPIGPMPVMFAVAMFSLIRMLLQLLETMLRGIFPLEPVLNAMSFTSPVGVAVLLILVYALNLVFSLITINPSEMAENFLKSGDYISNLRSGAKTRRYLMRVVFLLSFISSTVLSVCIGIPLLLQMRGLVDESVGMLPTTMMLLVGLYVGVYREIDTIRSFDSYKTFL